MNGSWLKELSAYKDGLFDKLASPDEGWRINDGENTIDVPLNSLDASAYSILFKAIQNKKKVAIALPRIKIGVSLSIIAYLVVNRFLKEHNRTLDNFIPLPLINGQPVIIATKNRKLRDFFLESALRFNNINFPFTHFPIYRINRLGNTIPLVGKTDSIGQIRMEPVIFYHFDSLDTFPQNLNRSYLLGELTETDSLELTHKLCNFIELTNIDTALILVNEFASNSIEVLKDKGFNIITYASNDVASVDSVIEKPNLPSLGSSLFSCPKKILFKTNLINQEDINSKLADVLKTLLYLNKKLGSDRPNILLKAWSLFYTLKDLSVPLERLEQSRKLDPWLKSINHNIDQIFSFPLHKLDSKYSSVLEPIWASLGADFRKLYEFFKNSSPKYQRLIEIIGKIEKSDQEWHIVFCSQSQLEVFREELLISSDWVEDSSNVKVGYINDYINNSEICERIILVGTWRKTDQAKILSLFPKVIYLLCYGTELPALPGTLNNLNRHSRQESDRTTLNSLKEVGINIAQSQIEPQAWIYPDEETQILISHYEDFVPKDEEELFPFEQEDWSLFGGDQDILDEAEMDSVIAEDSTSDEIIPAYSIRLENGKVIFIPTEQDVFAYSDDAGTIESKLPEGLEPGDVILLYSEDQNREMFENVLKRTQELSGVDTRVSSLWKTALKSLRETYEIKNPYSLNAYLHDLKDHGCTKTTQAVKQWLKGTTLAPRDQEDIECLLTLIEFKNALILSKIISREMEKTRIFHRTLGKRLRERLGSLLKLGEKSIPEDKIDREIDEILEMAEPVVIAEVSKEVKNVPKNEVRVNVFG